MRVKGFCVFAVLFIYVSGLYSQRPHILWWYDTRDASYGQSSAGDIDGDGTLEVVFGCYRNDSSVYALNAESGSLLWKYNTHGSAEGCNDVAPVIYDVDNDSIMEVVVPSSCNPTTFCFDGRNGHVKWTTPTRGSDSPPTIADIDNDGKPEILHGEFDGYIICINGEDGSVAWEFQVADSCWIQTAPTIVDVDGNGQLDFVAGTWSWGQNKFYAFRGNDHVMLWSDTISDYMYHGTAVADLDGDGSPELVIGSYNGTLYCFDAATGNKDWTYCYQNSVYYYIGAPATIADINGDGDCEVLFVNGWKVGALTKNGLPVWNFEIPDYETAFRGIALDDLNGDGKPDPVFGTSAGKLVTLDGINGDTLWTMDLRAHYGDTRFEFDNAPLIADFNNDDTLEVFIVGGHGEYPNFNLDFGRAYMISTGALKGNYPDWLMFQRDIRRQSSLCTDSSFSVLENDKLSANILVYPNPASDEINVQFISPLKNGAEIVITDMTGESYIYESFKRSKEREFYFCNWIERPIN